MSCATSVADTMVMPFSHFFVKKRKTLLMGNAANGKWVANDIIATTVSKTTPELHNRVVIVMQYRPAVNAYTLEFPAGCIDPHETDAMASALRELKEETGLTAQPSSVSSAYMFTYEPGITSSCGMAVTCTIDMDDPVTAMPTPHLEDGEWSLCTYLLPLDGLAARLQAFVAAHEHVMLDSRLGAFALGLQYASSLHLPAAAK
ncbi:NUDIX hydrolase domain-like protein [Blastocladiella britannica]|nr:NUDIX hydrolase domain-like protein [Blastocladiella britannica]